MRNGKIDFTRKLIALDEHRTAAPFNKFGPHFADENERCVIKFTDLQELPGERHLQQRPDPAGHNYEGVGSNHEMV